jgi:hypothetical protein
MSAEPAPLFAPLLDELQLARRREVLHCAGALLSAARMAGATDGQRKAAIMALRSPEVGVLLDEEAEALIEVMGLRAA